MLLLNTNKRFSLIFGLFLFLIVKINAQSELKIGSNAGSINASAALEVESTTKGLLLPRVALSSTTAFAPLSAHVAGMTIYNTATAGDVTPGYYFNDGSKWVRIADAANVTNDWSILGNNNTTDGTHFLGTTDNVPLNFRVNNNKAGRITSNGVSIFGYQAGNVNTASALTAMGLESGANNSTGINNTFYGYASGHDNTTGANNTMIGHNAGHDNITGTSNTLVGNAAGFNTEGNNNTFLGQESGMANTTGGKNTFLGMQAGYSNITTEQNVFVGFQAGYTNTASDNHFVGYHAGRSNTTGGFNTFEGFQAGYSNTTGATNTFGGYQAGYSNTTANANTAMGFYALKNNVTGTGNTAFGTSALQNTTVGSNTAFGANALATNTTGTSNAAVGGGTLYANTTGTGNTAIGETALYANTTGTANTALGFGALTANTTGTANTALGRAALSSNITGINNVAIGYSSAFSTTNGNRNTTVGYYTAYSMLGANDNTHFGYNAGTSTTTGSNNTSLGSDVLSNTTTGGNNVAIGYQAGKSNIIGANNSFLGYQSGYNNTASENSFLGYQAGYSNTSGYANHYEGFQAGYTGTNVNNNTAIGYKAMYANTASNNVAVGAHTLEANTSGTQNTALGAWTLVANTDGNNNTAIGNSSMQVNTTGYQNSTLGVGTLLANVGGLNNTAVGYYSLRTNISGNQNTGLGYHAGSFATGSNGTFVGGRAGYNTSTGANNTMLGYEAGLTNTTGSNNTFLGYQADASAATLTNAAAIGYNAKVAASNSLILGGTGADAVNVGINTTTPLHKFDIKDGNFGLTNSGTAGEMRFYEPSASGSNYSAFKAQGQATDITYTLPTADGTSGQLLSTNGTGTLSWATASSSGWGLTGNGSTVEGTNFIGTTDNVPFNFRVNNQKAGHIGNMTDQNLFLGYQAGNVNTTGWGNAFFGHLAGPVNTTGTHNTFIGFGAGNVNTIGQPNTFVGSLAGLSNTVGNNNHFIGNQAGKSNTTASYNFFEGMNTGFSNTTGANNHFSGYKAGFSNITSSNIFVIGYEAGYNNTASNNHFVGYQAGLLNTTGTNNTFNGYQAGNTNTTGSNNTFLGYQADASAATLTNAAAIGYNAKVAASNSLILGGTGADAVNVGINTTTPLHKFDIKDGNFGLTNSGTAGEMRFYEPSASGSNYSAFKAQAQATDITYTLPAADGSSGQLLSTNGTGILSWATGGGSGWGLTGNAGTNPATNFAGTTDAQPFILKSNNIEGLRVATNGYVGVNTASPTGFLHATSTSAANSVLLERTHTLAATASVNLRLLGNYPAGTNPVNTCGTGISFRMKDNVQAETPEAAIRLLHGTAAGKGHLEFITSDDVNGSGNVRMHIDEGGKVGIGVTNPGKILTLRDNDPGFASTTAQLLTGYAADPVASTLINSVEFSEITTGTTGMSLDHYDGGAALSGGTSNNRLDISSIITGTRSTVATFTNNGNVGIGTAAPTNKLDIQGTNPLKLNGLVNGAITDSVLTSASGVVRRLSASQLVEANAWSLTGNTGTNPATNYIGTTDAQDIVFKTNSTEIARMQNSTKHFGVGIADPAYRIMAMDPNGSDGDICARVYNNNTYTGLAGLLLQSSAGNYAAPSAILNSMPLGALRFGGYDGVGFNDLNCGEVSAYASENWSSTGHGTNVVFKTIPNGTTLAVQNMILSQGGNLGIGSSTPNVKLDISGAIAIRPSVSTVTADNQAVTVGNQSFLRLTPDGTSANRTITLSNGLQDGQQLVIRVSATGSNGIEMADSGNLNLTGTAMLDDGDTITLIWDGTLWFEMYRSHN